VSICGIVGGVVGGGSCLIDVLERECLSDIY